MLGGLGPLLFFLALTNANQLVIFGVGVGGLFIQQMFIHGLVWGVQVLLVLECSSTDKSEPIIIADGDAPDS